MSEVSSEAVEAAARALWGTDDLPAEGWDQLRDYQRDEWREWATAALTAALPYLAAHQPARVAPSAEEVADLRRQLATAQAVVRDLQRQPTVAEVREQVAREIEKAGNAALNAAYEMGDQGKAIYSDGLLDAARIARGETKEGE